MCCGCGSQRGLQTDKNVALSPQLLPVPRGATRRHGRRAFPHPRLGGRRVPHLRRLAGRGSAGPKVRDKIPFKLFSSITIFQRPHSRSRTQLLEDARLLVRILAHGLPRHRCGESGSTLPDDSYAFSLLLFFANHRSQRPHLRAEESVGLHARHDDGDGRPGDNHDGVVAVIEHDPRRLWGVL